MATTRDLFGACSNSYTLGGNNLQHDLISRGREESSADWAKAANAELASPPDGFVHLAYSYDKESGHGGVGYFNPDNGELIIAHRGTASFKDVVTDASMARKEPTSADDAALKFTQDVKRELASQYPDSNISHIFFTGHSKGGHEAQHCCVHEKEYPCSALTFNSPGIQGECLPGNAHDPQRQHFDALNVRTEWDPVSRLPLVGEQIGNELTLDYVRTGPFSHADSHTMTSLNRSLDRNQDLANADVRDVTAAARSCNPETDREAYLTQLRELSADRTNVDSIVRPESYAEPDLATDSATANDLLHPPHAPPVPPADIEPTQSDGVEVRGYPGDIDVGLNSHPGEIDSGIYSHPGFIDDGVTSYRDFLDANRADNGSEPASEAHDSAVDEPETLEQSEVEPSESVEPETTEPAANDVPDAEVAEPDAPEQPESVEPETTEPAANDVPDAEVTEPDAPEQPEPVEPETTEPAANDVPDAEVTEPDAPEQPEPVEPETTEPAANDVPDAEVTEPDAPEQPEPVEPETTEPAANDVPDAEVTEPDAPEQPEPVEPETTEPAANDVPDAEVTEPDAPDQPEVEPSETSEPAVDEPPSMDNSEVSSSNGGTAPEPPGVEVSEDSGPNAGNAEELPGMDSAEQPANPDVYPEPPTVDESPPPQEPQEPPPPSPGRDI
jgi:hypothetical protein